MTRTRPRPTSRRTKTLAILAGGTLVGVAVTATLAAWTDSEWIFGGDGTGGPGVGTSSFEVELNTDAPFADAGFLNSEVNPGQEVVFGLDALALTPGDSVYALVALRTADASVSGTVQLESAVPADGIVVDDPDGLLFEALDVRVATDAAVFDCDADAFVGGAGDPAVIADGTLFDAEGSATQDLAADAGSTQFYCFEVTLPDGAPVDVLDALQGRTVAPAWEFSSESF